MLKTILVPLDGSPLAQSNSAAGAQRSTGCGRFDPDTRVDHRRALGGGDDRVAVQFGNARMVVDQRGNVQDHVFDGFDIGRR